MSVFVVNEFEITVHNVKLRKIMPYLTTKVKKYSHSTKTQTRISFSLQTPKDTTKLLAYSCFSLQELPNDAHTLYIKLIFLFSIGLQRFSK